jgi:GNAT superfamily N-acetyltransferase
MSINKAIITPSTRDNSDWVADRLIDYNIQFVPMTHAEYSIPLNFHFRNDDGVIVAGVNAYLKGKSVVHVTVLWVDENQRGHDYGSQLLQHVETEAKKLGAYLIFLDTYDFQAREFYLKHGYEVFSILEGSPAKGHRQYNMKKMLA